ncbi:hypothetical protein AFLA_006107 [Aspergillus flavus NRRL3357]|nr:hypothetical protein AFLA_006107 [Aspergillus flavus NRRL3357]
MALLPTVSALSGPIQTVFSKSIIPEYQSALCLPHIGVAFALPSPCGHNHRFYFLAGPQVKSRPVLLTGTREATWVQSARLSTDGQKATTVRDSPDQSRGLRDTSGPCGDGGKFEHALTGVKTLSLVPQQVRESRQMFQMPITDRCKKIKMLARPA